jgi:hypothetical protein
VYHRNPSNFGKIGYNFVYQSRRVSPSGFLSKMTQIMNTSEYRGISFILQVEEGALSITERNYKLVKLSIGTANISRKYLT